MLIAIAGTMPNWSVILPAITPPSPKPNIISVKASDTAPRVAREFGLHHGNHHDDRPHADAADRADQQCEQKPHPGLTRSQG